MQREKYDHSRAFFRSAGGSPPLAVQIVPEPSDKISSIIWVVLLRCSFLCLQILSYSLKSDIFLLSLAISSARQDICVRMYISHWITLRTAIVFSVIYRCNAVQLFESAAEIADVLKSCFMRYGTNAVFGINKELWRTFQSVFYNVIYRWCMQVCPENIENTAFAYKNCSGNFVQCYLTAVIIVNILHHYLKLSLRLCGMHGHRTAICYQYAFI